MRQIVKQRLAAGAVAAAVSTAINFLLALYRYNRPRGIALTRAAHSFDFYSGGKHNGSLLIADALSSMLYVAIAIIPYELTMRALQSGRLRGED